MRIEAFELQVSHSTPDNFSTQRHRHLIEEIVVFCRKLKTQA